MTHDELEKMLTERGKRPYFHWDKMGLINRLCQMHDAFLEVMAENRRLRNGIERCLEENAHLADGDNCTLYGLKQLLKNGGKDE